MATWSRRTFLKTAGAATALGLSGLWPRPAHATWGDIPPTIWPSPPDLKVLEIHLAGGMAPFESFYFRPSPGPQTRGFDSEIGSLVWNGACANTPSPGLQTSPMFANDANTKEILLGPFAKPLWQRSDIFDRLRVVVLSYNLLPHEAATPFALTGLRLGNPNQASLGAAIAHRYVVTAPRALPYAYGLIPDSLASAGFIANPVGAVGRHPGAARPLVLKIGPGFATFLSQLQRANMSAAKDTLLAQYREQYRDWLRFQGGGAATRSGAYRDY